MEEEIPSYMIGFNEFINKTSTSNSNYSESLSKYIKSNKINSSDLLYWIAIKIKKDITTISIISDIHNILKLINTFKLLKKNSSKSTIFIDISKSKKIFMSLIEKVNAIQIEINAIQSNSEFNSIPDQTKEQVTNQNNELNLLKMKIQAITLFVIEFHSVYPNELSQLLSELNIRFKEILTSFHNNSTMREFIYLYVNCNYDKAFIVLKEYIGKMMMSIKELIQSEKYDTIVNELISIAQLFVNEFNSIETEFYDVISAFLFNYKPLNYDCNIQLLFNELVELSRKEIEGNSFEITNLMFRVYNDHLNNEEIGKAVIYHCFNQITLYQYRLLFDNSLLVDKYIKQLHKQKNQEIVSYFLEWIKQFSFESSIFDTFIPSKEFELIIDNFAHFDDNTPILLFILKEIKIILQKDAYAQSFINQPRLFKVIKEVVDKKDPTAIYFLKFIEELFDLNLYHIIFDKANEVKLFSFDEFYYHDVIRHQAIKLSLFYENSEEIFAIRANENSNILFGLLNQLKNNDNDKHYADNCEEIISVLNIILDSLSQGDTDVYNRVNSNVFDNLLKLIDEFTIVLIDSEDQMKYIFRLWNMLFKFISNINKRIMIKIFQPEEKSQIIRNPQFITQSVIERFISNGLLKYLNDKKQIFLRYLYEKCINFTLNDDNFNPIDSNYDPIHCLRLKYSSPNLNEIELKTQQEKSATPNRHPFVFIQSQILLKCLMNVIVSLNNKDTLLSFIDYLDYLCSISQFNASLMLQTGIIKVLIDDISSSSPSPQSKNEKVVSLLSKVLVYTSKADLEFYFKELYRQLIIKHDIDNAIYLLNILHKTFHSVPKRNYITLSKINTHHPQTYKFIYMEKTLTSSINIFISLYTESLNCLNNYTLCKISKSDFSFAIEFTQGKIHFLRNKIAQLSLPLNSQGENLKNQQWYNFLIQKGDNYIVNLTNALCVITVPDIINTEMFNEEDGEEQYLDFSMGYINYSGSGNKTNVEACNVDVSYILISKEKITDDILEQIEYNKINASKKGSLMQFKPRFTPNNILTEVLFSKIKLAKVQSVHSVVYKLNNHFNFDLVSATVIPTIKCNDTRNHDNVVYLLKQLNIIDYASMNMICDLNAINKSLIASELFPFFNSLKIIIDNIYFATMFYILLSQTDCFIQLYKPIINIILSHKSLQKKFIKAYVHELKMLFYFNSSELKNDFSGLLTIHNIIPIQEEIQDDCIVDIYLDPYLFTSLPSPVVNELLKKINLIVNHYNTGVQALNYSKIRRMLKQLMDLITFFELDCNIVSAIKEIIEEILNVFINESGVELEKTISLVRNHLITIANFAKNKQQINHLTPLSNFDIENIHSQMDILESYLKSTFYSKIPNLTNSDNCYIAEFFKIEFNFFKQSLQFDKLNRNINKNIRLLWPEYFTDYKSYSWALSDREGYSRMRKKLVLKENDMEINEAKENKYDLLSKKIEEYMKYWLWFERFSTYDSYSSSLLVHYMVNQKDKFQDCYFCLLFKNNEPIESLLIIGEKFIYVYYNIIINKNKKIHLSKSQTPHLFWARDNNYKEWDTLLDSNETKQSAINEFNYKSSQIRIKTILYTQISELHKRRHLHQNNSIEIFTSKGSSYFITVFPKCRDELFNKILSNINEQSMNSKIKYISKPSNNNAIYLKHYPIIFTSMKDKNKQETIHEKSVIDGKAFIADMAEKWAQYYIPNFNYLMLLNTISGRSYNDLTQYFIFPWMIKNFFTDRIDINNDDLYRDFAFPLHSQCKDDRENKKKNFEMKVRDEKIAKEQFEKRQAENKKNGVINKMQKYAGLPIFHSGTYYSNFSFVCYFMLRLSPFSSIGLSVRGTFSHGDRLFNSYDNLSSISKRYQEWIPELFYLPEMLVNINNYELGTMSAKNEKNEKKSVNDIIVPPWAHNDPRFVPIVFNRILEKGKASEQLANWIDLIFGYKLIGKECIEAMNMFNDICYPYEDLKEKKMSNEELASKLDGTANLGCCPIQIFTKPHIQRKPFNPGKPIPFYESNSILHSIQPQKSNKQCCLKSRKIGDMKAFNETPRFNISKGEGGLSAFSFTTDAFNEDSFDKDAKIKRNYIIAGKNKCLIGPKFSIILSHSVSSLYITSPVNSVIHEFPLNELSPIKTVISSINGKYIIAGLLNGNLIKYRKKTQHQEALKFPFQEITKAKMNKANAISSNHNQHDMNQTIFYHYRDISFKSCDFWESSPNPPSSKNPLKKSLKVYGLFEENRSGIPTSSIVKMDLCECYSFLLVIDQLNNVYQYDFNMLKLLYYYQFNHISNTKYPIKYAKIIHKTGDYLIGTKYTIHLFSINALPLACLNMFEQDIRYKYLITSCECVALDFTYIFTGHYNGNLIVWRIKTEEASITEKKEDEHPLFEAFHQRYRNSFKEKKYTDDVFSQRRFEIMKVYNINPVKIIYVKLSDDLLRLYYIDKEMNIFRLSSDDYLKSEEGGANLKNYKTVQYSNKAICKKCKKALPNYIGNSDNNEDNKCECAITLHKKSKTFEP